MGILILGVVLLVVGVGATYIYDSWKVHKTILAAAKKNQEADRQARQKIFNDELEKLQRSKAVSAPRHRAIPTVKHRMQNANSLPPDEATYVLEDGEMSINSRQTIDELIAKIEKMKKNRL